MHILTPCTLLLLGAAHRPALLRHGGTNGGGVSGDRQEALWPQISTQELSVTPAPGLQPGRGRVLSGMAAAPSALNSTNSCDGPHSPLACAHAYVHGPGQPQAHAVSSRESPAQLISGGVGVTVQLVPRDPPLAPCMVGSSGKIRAVVMWKEEWAPELVLKLCLLQEMWAEQGLPGGGPALQTPQEEEGAVFLSSSQNHGLSFSLPCPPVSTTNPGSYSYSQPSSRAVGSWAGPVDRAGLTIAARDSRRAFGAVGLYVWRDLGSR